MPEIIPQTRSTVAIKSDPSPPTFCFLPSGEHRQQTQYRDADSGETEEATRVPAKSHSRIGHEGHDGHADADKKHRRDCEKECRVVGDHLRYTNIIHYSRVREKRNLKSRADVRRGKSADGRR